MGHKAETQCSDKEVGRLTGTQGWNTGLEGNRNGIRPGHRAGTQGRDTEPGQEPGHGVEAQTRDTRTGHRVGTKDTRPGHGAGGEQGRHARPGHRAGTQGRNTGPEHRAGTQGRDPGPGHRAGTQVWDNGPGQRTGAKAGRQGRDAEQNRPRVQQTKKETNTNMRKCRIITHSMQSNTQTTKYNKMQIHRTD